MSLSNTVPGAPPRRPRDRAIGPAVVAAGVAAGFAAPPAAAPGPASLVATLAALAAAAQWLMHRGLHRGPRWLAFFSAGLPGVVPQIARAWYGPAWDWWGPAFWRVTAVYAGLSVALAFAAQLAGAARARRAAPRAGG